ncbi:hypothetical protein BH09SUM1_BH09SUM1_10080 [soil metagenome]
MTGPYEEENREDYIDHDEAARRALGIPQDQPGYLLIGRHEEPTNPELIASRKIQLAALREAYKEMYGEYPN